MNLFISYNVGVDFLRGVSMRPRMKFKHAVYVGPTRAHLEEWWLYLRHTVSSVHLATDHVHWELKRNSIILVDQVHRMPARQVLNMLARLPPDAIVHMTSTYPEPAWLLPLIDR